MGQWFSSSEKKKSTKPQEYNRQFYPVVNRRQYEPQTRYQPYTETNYNVGRSDSINSRRNQVNQTISSFPYNNRNISSVSSIGQHTRPQSSSRAGYSNATSVSSYEHRPTSRNPYYTRNPTDIGYLDSYLHAGDHNTLIAPRTRTAKLTRLYHYTTIENARRIRREKLVRTSTMSTPWKYRQHGCGVYFTSLDPSVNKQRLALNNFTNGGTYATAGLIRKVQSVVEIDFYENEVEKIRSGNRNIFLYRGSIDLRKYEGRYRIYENTNF